jgi:hypothetical protein
LEVEEGVLKLLGSNRRVMVHGDDSVTFVCTIFKEIFIYERFLKWHFVFLLYWMLWLRYEYRY